jgi:hypothetical protein
LLHKSSFGRHDSNSRRTYATAATGTVRGQQLGQHRRISDGVGGHFNGAHFQRLRIDAQMDLMPFTPVLGAMLLALSFALAEELDACAVHQQL